VRLFQTKREEEEEEEEEDVIRGYMLRPPVVSG